MRKHISIASLALVITGVACQGADMTTVQTDEAVTATGQTEEQLSLSLHPAGIYEEKGYFDSGPSAGLPFTAMILWQGPNLKFALAGSNPGELTYDPTLPDNSGPGSTVFYDYANDGTGCTSNVSIPLGVSKRSCSMTENLFFVGVPTPFTFPLDVSYTTNIGVASQPQADAGQTHDSTGGGAVAFFVKADPVRCEAFRVKIAAFLAGKGTGILTPPSLCL
jgi:hypothetical protein